jgi:hypothetical protein
VIVDESNWPLLTGGCSSEVAVKASLTVLSNVPASSKKSKHKKNNFKNGVTSPPKTPSSLSKHFTGHFCNHRADCFGVFDRVRTIPEN